MVIIFITVALTVAMLAVAKRCFALTVATLVVATL